MTNFDNPHGQGLANMLEGAVTIPPGASVLVAYEDASLGWYDVELKDRVIEYCREILSVKVDSVEVGLPANTPSASLEEKLQEKRFDWIILPVWETRVVLMRITMDLAN